MPDSPAPRVSRRVAVAAVLGVGAAVSTGCEATPARRSPGGPSPAGAPTTEVDPDRALVTSVRDSLLVLAGSLESWPGRGRPQRRLAAGLQTLHREQAAAAAVVLGPGVPPTPAPPTQRPATGAGLADLEHRGLAPVATAVDQAVSGDVARWLASLSAGWAQGLVALGLPAPPVRTPSGQGVSSTQVLQSLLAVEHGCNYLLGVMGGRTSASAQPNLYVGLRRRLVDHRGRRDLLVARLVELGSDPVPADAAYEVPPGLRGSAQIREATRELDQRVVRHYLDAVALLPGGQRGFALGVAVTESVGSLKVGAVPEILPGSSGTPLGG